MYDTELGKRLRLLRQHLKLTQKKVAEKLNLNNVTYAHYELSKREPDHETLIKIANFFNVTTDYLLGLSNSPHKTPLNTIKALGSAQNIEQSHNQDILQKTVDKYGAEHLFTLTIIGNDLAPFFVDKDLVSAVKTNIPEDNCVMIIKVDDGDFQIKKIQFTTDGIALISFDNILEVALYSQKDMDKMKIIFLGKVISIYRQIEKH